MRQKLGQHFLVDAEVPQIMVAALEPTAGDTIIEVGPGHGELTQAIIAEVEARGLKDIKVIAVEKDPLLAEEVRQRFQENKFFGVVEADILKFLKDPVNSGLLSGKFKIAGNLPYYLTGHLLRIVGELQHKPDIAVTMVQKEVAERLTAQPPRMNRLAAAVQFWAEPQILLQVPRKSFNPPPEVDSAVVLLSPCQPDQSKTAQNSSVFYETIRYLFAQPRKTTLNNLRKLLKGHGLDAESAASFIKNAGIEPQSRPQDLSMEKISALADKFSKL